MGTKYWNNYCYFWAIYGEHVFKYSMQNVFMGNFPMQVRFHSNLRNWKDQKLPWNIRIHGGLLIVSFHFPQNRKVFIYDFGPNGNHRESLKALRVVLRMPAGFFSLS